MNAIIDAMLRQKQNIWDDKQFLQEFNMKV